MAEDVAQALRKSLANKAGCVSCCFSRCCLQYLLIKVTKLFLLSTSLQRCRCYVKETLLLLA